MGVRIYDKENMSTGDSCTTTTNTNYDELTSSPTTATTNTSATQTTSNCNNFNFQKTGILREIVGNFKEMRIGDNFHNLRIIGNNNRIRMTLNVGDITIIGNNTRLKIKINHGLIKYTGNDGCISLGKESTEQLVDYSGCNGVLKVQNSKKSGQVNAHYDVDDDTTGNTSFSVKLNSSKKQKCASFSGLPSASEVFRCHNTFWRKKSLPNVTTKSFHIQNEPSNYAHQLPKTKNIVNNFGNIVVTNSSNVCISPCTHNY